MQIHGANKTERTFSHVTLDRGLSVLEFSAAKYSAGVRGRTVALYTPLLPSHSVCESVGM